MGGDRLALELLREIKSSCKRVGGKRIEKAL